MKRWSNWMPYKSTWKLFIRNIGRQLADALKDSDKKTKRVDRCSEDLAVVIFQYVLDYLAFFSEENVKCLLEGEDIFVESYIYHIVEETIRSYEDGHYCINYLLPVELFIILESPDCC
jgi:hypothetical protein